MRTDVNSTLLFASLERRLPSIAAGPDNLLGAFAELCEVLEAQGKYIVTIFPEYTPHDWADHIGGLFSLADRILGEPVYQRLTPAELALFAFGLAAHDWGMAVSDAELRVLRGDDIGSVSFPLLPGEPEGARKTVAGLEADGLQTSLAWREYLRATSGDRSGARLRAHLARHGAVFAEAVARIAEGHTRDTSEIRDHTRYPTNMSVFGETVNLSALATYVRIIDLLDIGDDRTPYALWKFVAPRDCVSRMHWDRHRALSPVSVRRGDAVRTLVVTGSTSDPDTFAALADLQAWIESQFNESMATLRSTAGAYDLDFDSRINWTVQAVGFQPIKLRFELHRERMLQLLSSELYDRDPFAFLRELLQNSVDAIDARDALLHREGATLTGQISVRLITTSTGLEVEWRDNGIGMDEEVIRSFFCAIGQSWYHSRDAQKRVGIEFISQFGIGILSCFAISDELYVETRRDPHFCTDQNGLAIEIPSRQSHFRVRRRPDLPIGTCVRLKITNAAARHVTKTAICAHLARISRFVRHDISLESDGVPSFLGAKAAESLAGGDTQDLMYPVRGETGKVLREKTERVDVVLADPGQTYTGRFSVLLPKRPDMTEETVKYATWTLEGQAVSFEDVILRSERAVFLKGVQAGPVSSTGRGVHVQRRDPLPLLTYTSWPPTTMLLNLLRPSMAQVDLSRSEVRAKGEELEGLVQTEIARKVAPRILGGLSDDPAHNALVLGSLAFFCGLNWQGLGSLLPLDRFPVLVLGAATGLHWQALSDFTNCDRILEAPFELSYAWEKCFPRSSVRDGWRCSWAGLDAYVCELSSKRDPWLGPMVSLSQIALRNSGWRPTGLSVVVPPDGESAPLACRYWVRQAPTLASSGPNSPSETLGTWGDASPALLHFDDAINRYAALGSRYWNLNHGKIQAIVVALRELSARAKRQELPDEIRDKYFYLASNTYYGFTVPSRQSGQTLGLSLPNELLSLAEIVGIRCEFRLEPEDFFPGTLGRYANPYHYPLNTWVASKSAFGGSLLSGPESQ